MGWGQQGPGTHHLTSRLEKVCCPLLPYPMTVRMHIKLPSFSGLWIHLHLSGIPLCLFYSYNFPPHLCPPSCLPLQFWMVIWPYLSAILGSDVGVLPSSSVPTCYPWCIWPLFLNVSGIETGSKTGGPSNVVGYSWPLCETIIFSLNCYPRIPLTKALLSAIIEASIVFSNGN